MRRASYIGSSEEYASYFRTHELTLPERQMLATHAREGVLTMREIANSAGWSSFRTGNRRYGDLAAKIRNHVGLPFKPRASGKPINAHCLFDDIGKNGEGEWLLRIHAEVIEGACKAGVIV